MSHTDCHNILRRLWWFLPFLFVFGFSLLSPAKGTSGVPGELAVLEVWGDRPLGVETLKENVAIHSNREYQFVQIPDFLLNLAFTVHEHKNPATLNCQVKKSGIIYLALWEPTTPKQLGLKHTWQSVGTMRGAGFQGPNTWTIYESTVQAGDTLIVKPPDRWGAVVISRQIKLDTGLIMLRKEYALLKKQLQQRRPGDKQYDACQKRLQKETWRPEALLLDSDRDPLDVVLRRTQALLNDIRKMDRAPALSQEAEQLHRLQRVASDTDVSDAENRWNLFAKVCTLRRRIAFRNPLLNFDKIIFLTHHKSRYHHMVDQYYGFHANVGGGVYILHDAFGENPRVQNVLENSVVQNGRLQGRKLEGGSFISLDLSYDGQEILFAWTEADPVVEKWTDYVPHKVLWTPQSTFHIFKVNIDGTNLVQLTDGKWNDFDPCFLPNGRIAFISERRGGYLRCGLRPDPTYTLHGMQADGSDIITLSYHETHEWHPSVNHHGMIVYTRWDYVDRDSDIAHHLWLTYPDGRDPRSYHGNYPTERESRPWMEMSIRAIPNSHRYVSVAAPHHGQAYGSLVIIDQQLEDNRSMSQIKRLTPDVHFPESETQPGLPSYSKRSITDAMAFGTPWPLSENYYLCVYDADCSHYGMYLIDGFGNRELIYRDSNIPCLDPIPLQARRKPPVIPVQTLQAQTDHKGSEDRKATIAVMNVYDSDFVWPRGTQITALRVIQLFPKTTPAATVPNIGVGNQSLARGVLGTVPVEADGSAYFEAPTGIPIYFQALDKQGLAVQSMRSDTYVHAGEQLTCLGCHEPKRKALNPGISLTPLALRRPPSVIRPDVKGSYPVSFARLVQPVLDRKCVRCHAERKACNLRGDQFGPWGWSQSYHSLSKFAWAKHGGNGWIRKNGTSYSIAGEVGANASRLYPLLQKGHYDVSLRPEEWHRFTLWLDCNSTFYGAYNEIEKQAQGMEVVSGLK